MSSLFDVPQQLVLILSLAAAGAGDAPEHSTIYGPPAKAAVSDEGPLHFREQRWLEAVKDGAGGPGASPHASRVFRTSSGRFYVPAEGERKNILKLRRDGEVSARVALGLARLNMERLARGIGRAPTPSELYLAHTFGSETAIAMINLAETRPNAALAEILPEAVAAHPELAGARSLSIMDLVQRLEWPFERRPSGADVARWFERSGESVFALDLKGSVEELPVDRTVAGRSGPGERSPDEWSASIVALP